MSNVTRYARKLDRYLTEPISEIERLDAERWYAKAYEVAADIGAQLEAPPEIGACILSAFSIRTRWRDNVRDAFVYARGGHVLGMEVRRTLADASLVHGFDAFKSPKTHAFARAIAGDKEAVVVDRWIARAAGLQRDAPTVVQYREISKAVTRLAKRHDMTPRGMQALIWGRIRGSLT